MAEDSRNPRRGFEQAEAAARADWERTMGLDYDDPRIYGGGDEGRWEEPNSVASAKRFPVLHVDELVLGDDPTWLIDGLLPAKGFGIVFGPPKSLKSFLLADALFHVAMNQCWAGRNVMGGAVVYVTAEGVEGFKRRIIALRRHYSVEGQGVPFLIVPAAPDLGHTSGDDAVLIATIRDALRAIGNPPLRCIAIDTLARTMKGADENTAKDMSVFVDNCGNIGEPFDCLVVGVHHAGKDVSKGSRGSNALDGAVDVMWSVEKNESVATAKVHYMKDAEDGISWQFRLQEFVLREASATTQFVAAAVVEMIAIPGQAQQGATNPDNVKIGDHPKMLLKIIREALSEMGKHISGDAIVPHTALAISRDDLKRYLPIRGYWDGDKPSSSNRARFSADLKTLNVKNLIGLDSRFVWFVRGMK